MKYILALLLLCSCSNSSEKYLFDVLTCNRDNCNTLTRTKSLLECEELILSISTLHKERKDKPTKALFCAERLQ